MLMRKGFILVLLCFIAPLLYSAESVFDNESALFDKYKSKINQINEFLAKDSSFAHRRLSYLCDTYGHRLSGSKPLEDAISWIYSEFKKDGFDNVQLDDVMVPNWKRGKEYCNMVSPRLHPIKMLALGGSIGTNGIMKGEVFVVNSKVELFANKDKAKGKIVLFNAPFVSYGQTVQYRVNGNQWAAQCGAIASMIRSVSPRDMHNPHTGVMYYKDSIAKIPHFAITSEDAELLSRFQSRGTKVEVDLYMEAHMEKDALSHNVMADLKGSVAPDKIIVAGGHIDSWDVGSGAMDDASGCVAAWEAIRVIKELNLQPKHTLRICHWTNEENGGQGGRVYADNHDNEKHLMAFEFDSGVLLPNYVRFSGDSVEYKRIQNFEKLLKLIDKDLRIGFGGGGADIAAIVDKQNIPAMSLSTEDPNINNHYFYFHHADTDTPEKVLVKDFNKCIAAIAASLYLYSEMKGE